MKYLPTLRIIPLDFAVICSRIQVRVRFADLAEAVPGMILCAATLLFSSCASSSDGAKNGVPRMGSAQLYEGAPKPPSEVATFRTTGTSFQGVDGRLAQSWPDEVYLLPGRHEFKFPDMTRLEVIELKAGHIYERPAVHFLVDAKGNPLRVHGHDGTPSADTRAALLQGGGALGFGTTYTYHMFVDRTTKRMASATSPMFRRLVNADRGAAASELGVPPSSLP